MADSRVHIIITGCMEIDRSAPIVDEHLGYRCY